MKYAIFGTGRVGASMGRYLESLGHAIHRIARSDTEDASYVRDAIAASDVVALAVPDGAIADLRARWRDAIGERPAVHFSGALVLDGVSGFHPLYSFPTTPLDPNEMRRIPFAVSDRG
ncbi:MAG: hypothetical protein AAGJ87_17260, partial [Pseudomonadota bacterium]